MALVSMKVSGDKEMVARLSDISSAITEAIPKMIGEKVEVLGEQAGEQYASAAYDGDNDVTVSVQNIDDHTWQIVASGSSVLFIEYGSGIIFKHDSQFGDFAAYGRKSWSVGPEGKGFLIGKKLAKYHGWWRLPKSGGGRSAIFTAGNPSANVMYETSKTMKNTFLSEARMELREALR